MKKIRGESGFTLLEVIVSLAIAVVGIAAVAKTTGSAAGILQATEQRLLSGWVASNRLAELKVTRAWPQPNNTQYQTQLGGRTWYVQQIVSQTDHQNLRRVEVEVYIDEEYLQRDFTVIGYIARYLPPEEPQESDQESEGGDENGFDDQETELGEEVIDPPENESLDEDDSLLDEEALEETG